MQDFHLERCKQRIEEQLGWGPAASWDAQDFEELSVRMHDKTGQVISATTLKRIWGRVAYESKPSRHSLDALARFIDYDSWRDFATTNDLNELEPIEPPPSQPAALPSHETNLSRKFGTTTAISIFMLLLGASAVVWLGVRFASTPVVEEPNNVRFASRSLANNLPNTVIFEYDVKSVEGDSFFIQQSWDSRLRTRVSQENNVHSSVYFYPGYYNAKLIANDSVVQELPVHVKTDNWTAMLLENEPIYLPEEAYNTDGTFSVADAWLKQAGHNVDRGELVTGFYYVQDFGPLHSDNFTMEAVVRHIKADTRRPCRGAQVTIRAEDGMIRFPFDIPGCAGAMHVFAGETHHPGDKHDLSVLGADYSNWQAIKLEVKEKHVQIQVGTNPPYAMSFTRDMGKVVGMWFEFSGHGALDEIRLKDGNDRVIYEEGF